MNKTFVLVLECLAALGQEQIDPNNRSRIVTTSAELFERLVTYAGRHGVKQPDVQWAWNHGLGLAANELLPVFINAQSSNLEAMAYVPETTSLYIRFKGGGTYHYDQVTLATWEAFQKAESKGKFFHANIKPIFPTSKVGG